MKAPGKICTLQTLFLTLKIAIFWRIAPILCVGKIPSRPRGILSVDTIGSPDRGILCVDKIGSVAPELHGWPGRPSKPGTSSNDRFYWLTRKRAPPCWGCPLGVPHVGGPCKNRVRAGIGGWPGTATGGQIHVVHISHTHPPKEIIQALRKYLLGKNELKWRQQKNENTDSRFTIESWAIDQGKSFKLNCFLWLACLPKKPRIWTVKPCLAKDGSWI